MPQCYLTAIENHTEPGYHWSVGEGDNGFSYEPCDSCGTKLGGNRFCAVQINPTAPGPFGDRVIQCSICEDCLMFHANGDEPEIFCESCEECSGPLHQHSQF